MNNCKYGTNYKSGTKNDAKTQVLYALASLIEQIEKSIVEGSKDLHELAEQARRKS